MLNDSLFFLSLSNLQDLLVNELTIFHVALFYVLMYVIYKALGRYVYFKPQEHASKINRTFLLISILVLFVHTMGGLANYLPILPEYRWLYVVSCLVLLFAPLSITMFRIVWRYDEFGNRYSRRWHNDYLQIPRDYYKTNVSKSERDGLAIHSWEEEGVESTGVNIHSDALLNMLALTIFATVVIYWGYLSALSYGPFSHIFSTTVLIAISCIFVDNAIFSWIHYLEKKGKELLKSLANKVSEKFAGKC